MNLLEKIFSGSPYVLEIPDAHSGIKEDIESLEERITLLRKNNTLNEATIMHYYGNKRFEQVAESNAIEGSTLSIGETEVAITKGVTISGHDPAYTKDAIALNKALDRLKELAKNRDKVVDITEVTILHKLILGDRNGAGMFRKEPVIIGGSKHIPPKDWQGVMKGMEDWEQWSEDKKDVPTPIRVAVLHAWLAHIHPFIDGNGRTARDISNLELIRYGYPPIIIKKKERIQYIQALNQSDDGDIRRFLEFIIIKINAALTGLENAAKEQQNYDPGLAKLKKRQEDNLQIYLTSIKLLAQTIKHYLNNHLDEHGGSAFVQEFEAPMDIDDYNDLMSGEKNNISHSWCFSITVKVHGQKLEQLAYIGHCNSNMTSKMDIKNTPTIYWSEKNPKGYPQWLSLDDKSPFCKSMTIKEGMGDSWMVELTGNGEIKHYSTTDLAKNIVDSLMSKITNNI